MKTVEERYEQKKIIEIIRTIVNMLNSSVTKPHKIRLILNENPVGEYVNVWFVQDKKSKLCITITYDGEIT